MNRLIATFCRITLGEDTWETGDHYVMSCSVTVAQDARASSCEFTLDDPARKLASKYIALSQAQGGIVGLPQDQPTGVSGGSSSANANLSPNMRAFLDTIAYAEGTDGADGYRTMYTGKTFTDLSKHPRQVNCSGGLCSDAAGRYQFLSTTWDGLGQSDFSPASQDIGATKLIDQQGATADVESGNISAAIYKVNDVWASFPGSPFGQPTKTEAELLAYYNKALAKYQGTVSPTQTASTVGSQPVTEPKATEIKDKGAKITIGLGFDGKIEEEFSFTHTETEADIKAMIITFRGQSIRWQMNRRLKNTSYSDITFKELVNKIATENGVKLDFSAPDVKFKYMDQTQLTDYQFLHREAKQLGFQITENKKNDTLIVRQPQAVDSGYVVRYGENVAEGRIVDKALYDLQPVQDGTPVSQPTPSTTKSEAKWTIDSKTGNLVQIKPEQQSTGKKAASGAKSKSVQGVTTTDTTANRQSMQRVKGLPSEFSLVTEPATLKLEPGQGIKSEGFGDALDRAWVIDSLTHTLSQGTLKTTLNCYSPMMAPIRPAPLSDPLPGSSSPLPQIDGWQWPIAGTSCGARCEFGYARGRLHAGIDIGGYGSDTVYAANSGVVDYAQNNGAGYGNLIIIKHQNGYETYYAHLAAINVSPGQQVKVGQPIGVRGNTGGDYEIHLHHEVRLNGQPVDPRTVLPKAGAPPVA